MFISVLVHTKDLGLSALCVEFCMFSRCLCRFPLGMDSLEMPLQLLPLNYEMASTFVVFKSRLNSLINSLALNVVFELMFLLDV